MKKNFLLFILCLACLLVGLVNGCKKDPPITPPTDIGTKVSFIEEFENVNKLVTKGWILKDNSPVGNSGTPEAIWEQGFIGADKTGEVKGFVAYSFTGTPDEFAFSLSSSSTTAYSISSWIITPVLSVKNGDKISFYSRGDSGFHITDRMQVLMNKSASADVGNKNNSVGGFTNVLFDINSTQTVNGYPILWTKYEYTFSGISGKTDTRIGFRHYVTNTNNAGGIGIDLFKFEVN